MRRSFGVVDVAEAEANSTPIAQVIDSAATLLRSTLLA
jgi:hypothetical protein